MSEKSRQESARVADGKTRGSKNRQLVETESALNGSRPATSIRRVVIARHMSAVVTCGWRSFLARDLSREVK